jgi:hypothetical protein
MNAAVALRDGIRRAGVPCFAYVPTPTL